MFEGDDVGYMVAKVRKLPKLHRAVWKCNMDKVENVTRKIKTKKLNAFDKKHRWVILELYSKDTWPSLITSLILFPSLSQDCPSPCLFQGPRGHHRALVCNLCQRQSARCGRGYPNAQGVTIHMNVLILIVLLGIALHCHSAD